MPTSVRHNGFISTVYNCCSSVGVDLHTRIVLGISVIALLESVCKRHKQLTPLLSLQLSQLKSHCIVSVALALLPVAIFCVKEDKIKLIRQLIN